MEPESKKSLGTAVTVSDHIVVYAKEGLIKQNLAAKAMSKVKEVL